MNFTYSAPVPVNFFKNDILSAASKLLYTNSLYDFCSLTCEWVSMKNDTNVVNDIRCLKM